MTRFDRVTVASRAFCIAVILGLSLLSRDFEALLSLGVIAIAATTAIYVSHATPLATTVVVTVEAAVTGVVIAIALPGSVVFLPYMVVLALIAGMAGRLPGVSAVVIAQFSSLYFITLTSPRDGDMNEVFRLLSPWLITTIGAGLLGSWFAGIRRNGSETRDDASYEAAHRLLTQLRTVARRLSSGLDPVTMASHILDTVKQGIPVDTAAALVHMDGALLSPLAHTGEHTSEGLRPGHAAVNQCWVEMRPVTETVDGTAGAVTVLPLRAGSSMVGVVLVQAKSPPSQEALARLMPLLDDHAFRLDTALTFDEVRSIATVEERRRLAREIHDGIAQEVASLGYFVDDLVATAESEAQRESLRTLRHELTRVVSELRLSIFDLRSEVLPDAGLGVALSDYVRQVGTRSNLTVHVTLDEGTTRLRPEIETQLPRIAQEAITNARKRSEADNLWVDCRVDPPFAELVVRDDGVGLKRGRADSYGLRIMRERTERLNGELHIGSACDDPKRPGTMVKVTIDRRPDTALTGGGDDHGSGSDHFRGSGR